MEAYLDAMKGVMSNSRGKETYVVIFRRSLAECSNRWGMARAGGEGEERGGGGVEKWKNRGRKTGEGRESVFRNSNQHHYVENR